MRLHTHAHTHTRTHTEWLAGFGLQIQWTRLNSWAHDKVKDFSKSSSESSLVQASEGHLIFLCTACIRSPHTFNTPCPLFNKRRPSNQWHGNTEITCNTTGKIRMMTALLLMGDHIHAQQNTSLQNFTFMASLFQPKMLANQNFDLLVTFIWGMKWLKTTTESKLCRRKEPIQKTSLDSGEKGDGGFPP